MSRAHTMISIESVFGILGWNPHLFFYRGWDVKLVPIEWLQPLNQINPYELATFVKIQI